jgi:hypothetical protein
MRLRFLPACLFALLMAAVAWAWVPVPRCKQDPASTIPVMAVYTTTHDRACGVHAAVYPGGRLIWTPGYRELAFPKPYTSPELETGSIYSVQEAMIDPAEVAALAARIRARKQLAEYKHSKRGVIVGYPYPIIAFREGGEGMWLSSSYEFDPSGIFHTPAPPAPEEQIFLDDWAFLKGQLFDLVEAHEQEGITAGPFQFAQVIVEDGDTTATLTPIAPPTPSSTP